MLFSDGALNDQSTFEMGSKLKLVIFEMSKPKLSDSNQTLSFKVRGIGEKDKDLLTGLRNKRLSDPSLFMDDGTTGDRTVTMKVWNDSRLHMEMKSLSSNTVFGKPTNVSGYTDSELDEGDIFFTCGQEWSAEVVFELPVTLTNGLQEPPVDINIRFVPTIEGVYPAGQCDYSANYSNDGPTTVYYSINGGATQSVEATCGIRM